MKKTVEDLVKAFNGVWPIEEKKEQTIVWATGMGHGDSERLHVLLDGSTVRRTEFEATAARMGYRSSGIDPRPIDEYEQQGWDEHQAQMQKPDGHYSHQYKGIKLDPYRIAWIYRMQGGPREQIMKKCLRFTDKGQTEQQVVDEIRSALNRWQAMLDEDTETGQ